ncbi:hypothetical protein A5712_27860 [Mycobacterium sp. E2327]|uniref:AMP-binding protein n=1 Tax=Mycobacterium sp. E2327 TaxID=1834132 RepID=UPI0007FD8705|nr:AMP-binding protein [Mycobacterium sp. E2327]OBI15738.1 hypothetical protein A5712_27860 [Mycobacterium sp. E2327]
MSADALPEWQTISGLCAVAAEKFPDQLAIADDATELTYAELFEQAARSGAAFVESGVRPGDRVAIWAFNCVEWVIAYLGLILAGAALVPINTRFKGREAADILLRSRARVLCTVTDFLDTDYVEMLRAVRAELPDLHDIVNLRGPVSTGAVAWQDFLGRSTSQARVEVDRRRAAATRDDVADILFTSGTTGTPKGVVMTHGRSLHVAYDYVQQTDLRRGDRYLMVNPYFHMFGLKAGIIAAVGVGATMFPEPVFDAGSVLRHIEQHRISVMPGPPTLFQGILEHPDRRRTDLSSLRVAVTGATDIPIETMQRIFDAMPSLSILNGYGLTEAGTATGTSVGDDIETIVNTSGRPRPGVEIRIVDKSGADVPTGSPGEIWIRSARVMLGYLDDPAGTAAALTADGYLKTGDLGILDEQRRLRIVGRIKDMFIVGGFNAYPVEIENALMQHPDIGQVAVIGVPHERLGEVGMAYVVPKPGVNCDAESVIAWARTQMANYKVPQAIEIVDALPINATGKIQKTVLRERAAQGRATSPA